MFHIDNPATRLTTQWHSTATNHRATLTTQWHSTATNHRATWPVRWTHADRDTNICQQSLNNAGHTINWVTTMRTNWSEMKWIIITATYVDFIEWMKVWYWPRDAQTPQVLDRHDSEPRLQTSTHWHDTQGVSEQFSTSAQLGYTAPFTLNVLKNI